ncbi:FecR family protein [Oceanibaculum pacificum]|uniref:Iron dicitrate transport regulator FecR n=1 Tax=Oceanibaculum pacificum TaxID=580166 RepID=A0A154W2Y4_9PROT|nr:FecR domain-containing protein [Oceanibaculum pacificum]KZD07849.1 hypothetical protein AUP43_09510 [Oceanibaculum pacificum]
MSLQPTDPSPDSAAETAHGWVVRLASGEMTHADMAALRDWLDRDAAHRLAFEEARATWRMAAGLRQDFATATQPAPAQRFIRWAAGMAAAALVALALFSDPLTALRADASTAVGEQRRLVLDDGSTVHLNTDSAIAVRFAATERRIELLRGEAYFEVAPNPDRPFIVAALDGTARAVGTAFSVRESGDRVSVAVSEGKVSVTAPAQGADSVLLGPGEQARYGAGQVARVAGGVAPDSVAAWRGGRIVFDGLPFTAAVAELDRYLPGAIVIAGALPAARPVSGVFATDALDGAVDALAQTQGLRVLRVTRYLTILR